MRRLLAVFVGVLVLSAIVVGGIVFKNGNIKISNSPSLLPVFHGTQEREDKIPFVSDDISPPQERHSFLTGLLRSNFSQPEKGFALMLEESVAARPYYRGIESAKILFEMPAEGGIPRFSAIFSTDDLPVEIGPVRSARDYFLKMITPLVGAIVHAGGSPQALAFLQKSDLLNINHENEEDSRFYRDEEIHPPHNLFLRSKDFSENIPDISLSKPLFVFSDAAPTGEPATEISLDFSTENHRVDYTFSPADSCFLRIQKYETAHLCFENIAVMETEMWLLNDEEGKGRIGIRTTGEGTATVFRDGIAITGKWKRTKGEKIRFFDDANQEISFHPGKTIIEAIDKPEKQRFSGINNTNSQ